MAERCEIRLTVIGTKGDVLRFQYSRWEKSLQARYTEPIEWPPRRFVCQFETIGCDLNQLQSLSRRWPRLVFLLDYEIRRRRVKGIVKAKAGELEHHLVRY